MHNLFVARTRSELETHRRLKLCIWAYAYEVLNKTLVSDAIFDSEALKVDLNINTKRPDLDDWFRRNFDPSTGSWIHNHPEINKIERLANAFN